MNKENEDVRNIADQGNRIPDAQPGPDHGPSSFQPLLGPEVQAYLNGFKDTLLKALRLRDKKILLLVELM